MRMTRTNGPLYSQIRDVVRDRILHGIYAIGTKIPTESQLEKEFQVSKMTIRNAIKELVQKGYLQTKSGKGTKVIRNRSISTLSKGKQFTEMLVDQGYKVQKQLLDIRAIQNREGTTLYQWFGADCLRVERLYYLQGEPYIHYVHYLYHELIDDELSSYHDQSLYQLIANQDIKMQTFRDQFAVAAVPPNVAEKLEIESGDVLLKRERYAYDDEGQLVEYSEGYYNTGKQKYLIHYDV